MFSFSRGLKISIVSILMSVFFVVVHANIASAATTGLIPTGKVSFTFDDGYRSSLTKAAPVLAESGITGTEYITTGYIGSSSEYMGWPEVSQLAGYGWEIGGHSVTHPLSTTITPAQMEQEAANSKQELLAHGFNANSYATPYGDYDSQVIQAIARHFTSHRPFFDTGYNTWPYDDYLLKVQQVQSGVSVATVKSYIDTARANNQWLVLVFHDIKDAPSSNPDDYEYGTSDLRSIAQYVKGLNIKSVNVTDGLVSSDSNMVPGGDFANGISNGWTTDSPANVTADSQNHGATSDPTNSVKMTSSTVNTHLFSPGITVNSSDKYIIKGYVNIQSITSGEVGFYVDEYSTSGLWMSGVYMGAVRNDYEKELSVFYVPSSLNVMTTRLQIITTANSGIIVYIDNIRWFSTTSTTPPTPTPIPVPIPVPIPTNLLTNPGFESGLTTWTTDTPTKITLDTANNGGTTKKNSIKLVATTKNAHLFSQKVSVDSTKTYTIKSYINITKRTSGAVAFYIDEYNVSGTWISGQYIYEDRVKGITNVSFSYKPTSANVKTASLQVIVVKNSGITGYLDDISWTTA